MLAHKTPYTLPQREEMWKHCVCSSSILRW